MSSVKWDGVLFTNEDGPARVVFDPGTTVKRTWNGFTIYENGKPVSTLYPSTIRIAEFDVMALLDEVCA